jgi:hypothetical protein
MGTTSALKPPLAIEGIRIGARRAVVIALMIVALVVAAFVVGRSTATGRTASTPLAPAHQSSSLLGSDECRVGQPC